MATLKTENKAKQRCRAQVFCRAQGFCVFFPSLATMHGTAWDPRPPGACISPVCLSTDNKIRCHTTPLHIFSFEFWNYKSSNRSSALHYSFHWFSKFSYKIFRHKLQRLVYLSLKDGLISHHSLYTIFMGLNGTKVLS